MTIHQLASQAADAFLHAAALLMILVLRCPAQAQSAAEVAERAGLIGWWAEDCSKPPAQDNQYMRYEATAGGHVVRRIYRFPGIPNGYETTIHFMAPAGQNLYTLHFDQPPWGQVLSTLEIVGDRKRTMQLATADGELLVRDNIDVDDGEPLGHEFKCNAPDLS